MNVWIDFCVATSGDTVQHTVWDQPQWQTLDVMSFINDRLAHHFPSSASYLVLGNHGRACIIYEENALNKMYTIIQKSTMGNAAKVGSLLLLSSMYDRRAVRHCDDRPNQRLIATKRYQLRRRFLRCLVGLHGRLDMSIGIELGPAMFTQWPRN